MQIKKKTHYTMKVLIHLALSETNENKYLDIKEISKELDIAYEHTRKIVQALTKMGVLKTMRGRNGGIRLAKKMEEIHIYDIILEIEEVDIEQFAHDCSNCNMPIDCKFRHMLKEQYKAFYLAFEGIYLSDYIQD